MTRIYDLVHIDGIIHRTAWVDPSWMFGKTICQALYATDLRGFDASYQHGEYRLAPITCIACTADTEWPWP